VTTPDHLAVWLRVRERVTWRDVVPHPPAPVPTLRDGFDGFAAFARATAAGRDPRRLSGLLSAHDDVRRAVAAGAGLTPELTARWNRIARGGADVAFRRGPAFAKGGRERYGLHADTEHRYAAALAESADPGTPVTARAARAYLDVAFFHPYDDGNARLGGLVLRFVLLRGGIELDDVGPILTLVRRADDAEGAADLARLVHGLAAAARRRRLRRP
jgi:hypothetical protein